MDFFGKPATDLKHKKLFLLDMDGTIYNENTLFDGTKEFLSYLKENEIQYVFITNNSSRSVEDYVCKLRTMGIEATKEDFFTSTQASIVYLQDKYTNKKIYVQGTASLIKELCEGKIHVSTDVEEDIDAVLVGFDTELTSEKLRKTSELLTRKLPFIATNPDLACPVHFGFIPDCGSICQMLTNATGQQPLYIGKPNSLMVDLAMDKFSCNKEETVVVGDRLYTDIATGINSNVTAVCVLSGEAAVDDIVNGNIKPTFTFQSIKEILNELKSSE